MDNLEPENIYNNQNEAHCKDSIAGLGWEK